MNLSNELCIYKMLCAVYQDGAYSNIQLDKTLREQGNKVDRAYVTRTFYGVLENEMRYEFAIDALVEKAPKQSVKPILKMGMYLTEHSVTPDYAALDKCVELTKKIGKGALAGFVNAVLRRFTTYTFPDPHPLGEIGAISFHLNVPTWLAEKLLQQYPYNELASIPNEHRQTHIRICRNDITKDISTQLTSDCMGYGYYVTHNIIKTLDTTIFTVQSLSSMVAAHTYLEAYALSQSNAENREAAISVLDLCAAPGGKSVYLKELVPNAHVLACDLYEHRVSLIKSYAKRLHRLVDTAVNDACVLREDWKEKFDIVLCDVPCSGIGVLSERPDIILNRTEKGLSELHDLQKQILSCARYYVKTGGILCYSTCTILKEENQEIFNAFLRENATDMHPIDLSQIGLAEKLQAHGQNIRDGYICLMPDANGFDGFFIAAARRGYVS